MSDLFSPSQRRLHLVYLSLITFYWFLVKNVFLFLCVLNVAFEISSVLVLIDALTVLPKRM